jgi:RecJ-like exonuclease
VVPEEYQKCMVGMKHNLKQTLEIAETAAYPKTKLQARAIANDCYRFILEMSTNAGIVSDALKFVTQKQEQINTLHKLDERIALRQQQTEEEQTTINAVF